MEVDNELDQTLLQQFSCMSTSDKDDLIRQMQKIIGSDLNTNTATFFLDMNNWNLQGAVCCFFDSQSPVGLPSMALLRDITIGEGESIPPNTPFTKTWRVANNGDDDWPVGCCLQFSAGEQFKASLRIPVSPVVRGALTDISVDMVSPEAPGMYQSMWRMTTPSGSYFGEVIWVILTVAEGGTLALTQQLSHLSDLGSSPRSPSTLNPFESTFNRVPSSRIVFQDQVQASSDADPEGEKRERRSSSFYMSE